MAFGKKKPTPADNEVHPYSRVSRCGDYQTRRPVDRMRVHKNLDTLRGITDVYKAIEFVSKAHPDVRMAVDTMLRLAGGGGNMEFQGISARQNKKLMAEWRKFCQRVNRVSGGGMDGLVNSIHKSLILYNAAAEETVVKDDASDIDDVYLILPGSIGWELENNEWVPYQWHDGKKWNLNAGNFVWQSIDPDVGKPDGTPQYVAALSPIEYQWQFMEDSAAVLRRMGYPRNDIEINREATLKSMPNDVRTDPKRCKDYFQEVYDQISGSMSEIGPTDDMIHFDDIKVNNVNKDNSRTIDLRAYNEIVDPQVMNGLGCLGVLLNRTTGVTETWGTVQFKIVAETVGAIQRCSKRIIESIAGIWLRTHGINAVAVYTPNVVDVESELKRVELDLKRQERERRAQEYNWQSREDAAKHCGYTDAPAPDDWRDKLTAYTTKNLASSSVSADDDASDKEAEGDMKNET